MTTLNPLINQYANGVITRIELGETLEKIGFTKSIVDVLLKKADNRKVRVQAEIESGEDIGKRFLPIAQCSAGKPQFSDNDIHNLNEDLSKYVAKVVCDGCGVLVRFSSVKVRYVEALDITYFYCPECGDAAEE
jgi:hypothetical protein